MREGIVPAWCGFGSSFPSGEEEEEGFSQKEDEGTKWAKGLFLLRVASVLCLLGVKKKRRRVFYTKKTKGLRARRDYSGLVGLRFFVSLV